MFSFIVSLIRFCVFQLESRFVELVFSIALAAQNNSIDASKNHGNHENNQDEPDVGGHEFATTDLIAKSL